eukprot:7847631-Pyramimonas_sp.AAC.1
MGALYHLRSRCPRKGGRIGGGQSGVMDTAGGSAAKHEVGALRPGAHAPARATCLIDVKS